jgi:lysophospholipase L1-like esterase
VLQLVSIGPPPVIQQAPGITTGRDNPDQQPTDLAVPGHLLHDLLYTGPVAVPTTDEEIITDLVLAFPLGNTNTQAQEAIALKPTFLFVWIGNNDALVADETGMPSSMTPIADFTTDFTTLMQGVHGETGATLVVANIPDVTLVPYLTPATTVIAEAATQTGLTTAQISTILGITDGDLVNATGLAEVQTDLQNIAANKATTPLDDAGFLSAAEVVQVQSQIAAYNAVIAQQVASANGILVDLNSTFTSLKSGVTINGYTATTGFLGGIFSLDGIHPTNTGYAIIANKFIDAINSRLTNAIPDVDLSTIAAADPLFPPNIKPTGGAAKLKHIPLNVAKQTDKFIRPHAH